MALTSVLLVSHLDLNIAVFRRPLIKALVARGVAAHVCVPPGPRVPEIEDLGATVYLYALARGSMNPRALPAPVRAIRAIIESVRPDVVHSFTHQPNIMARLARPRVPLVNSVTGLGSNFLGTGLRGAAVRGLFHTLYRATAERCGTMVFQNDDDRDYFSSRGLTGTARIAMIRGSGVDLARFRPDLLDGAERDALRAELGLLPEHVVCTLTARLLFDKGVREFLAAAEALAVDFPHARFLLVGEPDPGNPKSLAQSDIDCANACSNVVFAGWRDDMERVWALSDVAVLPSYREGLPVSLQEAAASGLPVVTTDVAGCREIARGGSHCVLVEARESAPLAEALGTVLADADLRREMGAAARRKAEADFDARALAAQHLALYDRLVGTTS